MNGNNLLIDTNIALSKLKAEIRNQKPEIRETLMEIGN